MRLVVSPLPNVLGAVWVLTLPADWLSFLKHASENSTCPGHFGPSAVEVSGQPLPLVNIAICKDENTSAVGLVIEVLSLVAAAVSVGTLALSVAATILKRTFVDIASLVNQCSLAVGLTVHDGSRVFRSVLKGDDSWLL